MRKPSWVRKSGPFECISYVNGYIMVKPSWPQYGAVWEMDKGGGPGIFGRMGLAANLEKWLNSCYSDAEIAEAHERIKQHDANLEAMAKAIKKRRRKRRRQEVTA